MIKNSKNRNENPKFSRNVSLTVIQAILNLKHSHGVSKFITSIVLVHDSQNA